ncbi:6-phosphogluconolactonase [Thorsellia kenyensis]|uniref:6-phosphogluconolactonase n=1 Tax=Thorsellia kenyensis TaxID=1549888 RepID=A0ABV6CCZ1_9GAMM
MNQKVYVACPENQEIHVFTLSTQGELSLVQIVAVPGQVQPMVFSKNKSFLYVGIRPDFQVLSYAIAPESGELSFAGSAPLLGSPTHIAIDNTGKYFFSASYSFNHVSICPISQEGIVEAPIHTIEGICAPHSVNPISDSNTILIPALKEDKIRVFNLANGTLIEADTAYMIQKGAGPRHITFHNTKQIGYCLNELDSTISTIKLPDENSTLVDILQTHLSVPVDFNQTYWSADIHITPNNRFLYCSERTSSLLTAIELNSEGLINKTIGYYDTELQPRGFAIDTTGKFLICAGQQSDKLSLYHIDQNSGELLHRTQYSVGKGAMWVLIK